MKPEIAFDIVVPENSSVSSKVISTTKVKIRPTKTRPERDEQTSFCFIGFG